MEEQVLTLKFTYCSIFVLTISVEYFIEHAEEIYDLIIKKI